MKITYARALQEEDRAKERRGCYKPSTKTPNDMDENLHPIRLTMSISQTGRAAASGKLHVDLDAT